jgi:hypothetical protein
MPEKRPKCRIKQALQALDTPPKTAVIFVRSSHSITPFFETKASTNLA